MMIPSALTAESRDVPVCSTGFSVKYRITRIDGIRMFYREAGPHDAPLIVLLHGFPSSSRMFATLLPLLANAGHFALDEKVDTVAALMRRFLFACRLNRN